MRSHWVFAASDPEYEKFLMVFMEDPSCIRNWSASTTVHRIY